MPMPSRRACDAADVLHRILAEEREMLSSFVYNSHMALTKKLECQLDALWEELPALRDGPSSQPLWVYLGQMETCSRVEEPQDDSSVPEVVVNAVQQSVPSKMVVKADWKDGIQTATCPPTENQVSVEQRSVGVLNGQMKDAQAGRHVVVSEPGSKHAVVQKTSSRQAAAGPSIREKDVVEDSRGKRILKG
eukprot:TRINITY_DN29198_c0_g2_i2.p2 TRINITY_DN29198_c0_g2~~TRINITY_DN29198_c0_g2_i2.p2  ORF type:complete len:191 (-),score=39.53 TRINITY_DN29198_c0_g2_i2:765-1337(-)